MPTALYNPTFNNYPQYYTSTSTTTNYIPAQYWTPQNATLTTTGTNTYQTVLNDWNRLTQDWYTVQQDWNQATPVPQYYPQNPPTQTTTSYANQIWYQWNNDPHFYQTTPFTPEQLQQIQEGQERQRIANEERSRQHQAARARARILLGEFLSDEQKAELEAHGRFHVTGSRGRRYCIRAQGQSGNVDLLKPDGSLQATLCAHPSGSLPEGDAWLMQMLEIRHDEDHFLRTANVHRGFLPMAA